MGSLNWDNIVSNTANFDRRPALPGAEWVVLQFTATGPIVLFGKRFANQRNAMRVANSLSGRPNMAHLEVHCMYS